MMRKLLSCSIVLSCLVNLYACDRIIVRKRPQGNNNYSDILVTKHNYNSYLTNIPSKLPFPQRNQSFVNQTASWELVAVNGNGTKVDTKSEQIPQGFTKYPNTYSFNCTLMGNPTTKLIPLLRRTTTFSPKLTSGPIRRPTGTPIRTPVRQAATRSSKKKVIYVNPPIISAVESMLNGAYDIAENVLTTKQKIRLTTSSPKKRTKKSPDGSKLITTQVQVTNKYEPVTQMSAAAPSRHPGKGESSEEYYEDDLLYDDSEDDEDSSSEDEDSIETPPVRRKPAALKPYKEQNLQGKPWIQLTNQPSHLTPKPVQAQPNVQQNTLKRKRRRPDDSSYSSDDSYEDYDDQDDQDDEEDEYSLGDTFKYGSPTKENIFDYLGNVMARFGKFITSLMGFGGGKRKTQPSGSGQVINTYSTTPKNRRPKRPPQNYYDFHDLEYPLERGNDLENKEATEQNVSEKGMWSGLGTWFSGGEDVATTDTPDVTETTEDKSWFFNIFSSSPTTPTSSTTEKPEASSLNPLDPGNFIALLAQHLVTTESPVEHKPDALSGQVVQKKVDYSNYQLWRLRPSNTWQVHFLTTLRSSVNCDKCQWWKGPSLRGPTDLVIPPEKLSFIEETLHSQGIIREVVISDLQKAITYSNPKMTRREQYEIELEQGHPVTFYRYHRFDDIVKFLEFLQRKYPENVELSHFGRSFEGLPLIMVKIFSQTNGTMELRRGRSPRKRLLERKFLKPVVMIEAGSHGREWIAPAVAMWILNTLAMGIVRTDPESEIFRSVDWLVVPVLNPDGYEFTHTTDRLWRKTRSRARPKKTGLLYSLPFWTWFQSDQAEELNCTGVDLNRNWNYEWSPRGLTGKPCGDLYSGAIAFSEPESSALHQFAMKHKKRITVFISLHSYGQMISVPKELRGRSEDLVDMAHVAVQALNGHSSLNRYLVDDADEMLFPRPGAVDAFMLNTIGVPYSYTLELRDTGTHGFLLPPSYIEATARDAFDIIKAIVDNL